MHAELLNYGFVLDRSWKDSLLQLDSSRTYHYTLFFAWIDTLKE